MQLRNDDAGRNALQDAVLDYYVDQGRSAVMYRETESGPCHWLYLHFLVDRSRVIRYAIGNDPTPQGDRWVGGVELAIGPGFFGPGRFWSFDQLERFRQSADTTSVVHNLRLLDEFWGITPPAKKSVGG